MNKQKELSLADVSVIVRNLLRFLISKIYIIITVGILAGAVGVLYAWFQKPVYTAEITFASEVDKSSSLGMYAGLAAQFGLDLGSGGGGIFEGDNLMMLLTSKMLVEKALFSPVSTNNTNLLIDYYLNIIKKEKRWNEIISNIGSFNNYKSGNRLKDSVLGVVTKNVREDLHVEKLDKKVDIIVVRVTSHDELFAKAFAEQIVTNGIKYYVDYKSGKTKENVQILQRQTDSVRNSLTGNIVSVATSTDLNVNPIRNIIRANVQRKQVDVQVNGQLYGELLKQLELSKIALRKETPLIQVIDTPRFPLEKKKLGRLKGAVIFGFIGILSAIVFFITKRAFNSPVISKDVTSV